MANQIVIENTYISGTTTYVHQANSCFLFFLAQNSQAGSQWLQNQVFVLQAATGYAFINILNGIGIGRDHMKISLQANT